MDEMARPRLICVLALLVACSVGAAASARASERTDSAAQATPAPMGAVLPPALPPYARHLLGADQWGACGRQHGGKRCTGNDCCSEWGYCGTGSQYCNGKSQSGYNGPGAGGGGGGGGGGGRACAATRSYFSCNLGSLCSRYGVRPNSPPVEVSDCACEDLCNDIQRGVYGAVPGPYRDTYCKLHPWDVPFWREISINGYGTVLCDPKPPRRPSKPGHRRIFQAPAPAAAA